MRATVVVGHVLAGGEPVQPAELRGGAAVDGGAVVGGSLGGLGAGGEASFWCTCSRAPARS